MKKLNYIAISAISALAIFAVSCDIYPSSSETPYYEAGAYDDPSCYRVSFPEQDVTPYEVDPADASATTVTIYAQRRYPTGKITVPLTITQDPFDAEFVFENTDLVFEDGQSEASFQVSFPKAEVGKEYVCHVMVTDPQFASMYKNDVTFISFKFMKVSWETVATGVLNSWWEDGSNIPGVVFQHCVTYPERYRFLDPYGYGNDMLITSDNKELKDSNGDTYLIMRVAPQESGYVHSSYGMINFRDVAAWQGNDAYASANKYYPADKYVQLWLQWYVSAGSFGYGYEIFQGQ